jgi:hypothetical protein
MCGYKKLHQPVSKGSSLFRLAMKDLANLLVVLFLLILAGENTLACECIFIGDRKAFKHANRVFIGEVQAIENSAARIANPEYAGYNAIVTFKIIKAWKGKKSGVIKTRFNRERDAGCYGHAPILSGEYLVYAKGKYFIIDTSVCSQTRLLDRQDERMQAKIRKLNSFWFRLKARMIPF